MIGTYLQLGTVQVQSEDFAMVEGLWIPVVMAQPESRVFYAQEIQRWSVPS